MTSVTVCINSDTLFYVLIDNSSNHYEFLNKQTKSQFLYSFAHNLRNVAIKSAKLYHSNHNSHNIRYTHKPQISSSIFFIIHASFSRI